MSDWQHNLPPIPPIIKEKLDKIIEEEQRKKDLYSQADLSQEAFIVKVKEKVSAGQPFILAVYQILDEFSAVERQIEGIDLACKKGCSVCCSSIFLTCTDLEMTAIMIFIERMPKELKLPLIERIRIYVAEWEAYYRANRSSITSDEVKVLRDWKKPCVFLEQDGSCAVYPVRIIDCRTYTSIVVCSPEMSPAYRQDSGHQGPVRFRFQSELWANNLILEEGARRFGIKDPKLYGVTPVLHWLLYKRSKLGI